MFSTGCYYYTHIRLVSRLDCSLPLISFFPPFVKLVFTRHHSVSTTSIDCRSIRLTDSDPIVCSMAARLFALIVGIDKYKSGNIWDLETCVNDAQSIKRWLTHDLHVPRDRICLLTDKQATQRNIEDSFMKHLVNNPAIEPGDAIIFYFAGHGSSLRAPKGWFGHNSKSVEVLCSQIPYSWKESIRCGNRPISDKRQLKYNCGS